MYHFISGYTAKVAGTEDGVNDPTADLLAVLRRPVPASGTPRRTPSCWPSKHRKHGANAWLVNTGWSGGAYGQGGKRMQAQVHRARSSTPSTCRRARDLTDAKIQCSASWCLTTVPRGPDGDAAAAQHLGGQGQPRREGQARSPGNTRTTGGSRRGASAEVRGAGRSSGAGGARGARRRLPCRPAAARPARAASAPPVTAASARPATAASARPARWRAAAALRGQRDRHRIGLLAVDLVRARGACRPTRARPCRRRSPRERQVLAIRRALEGRLERDPDVRPRRGRRDLRGQGASRRCPARVAAL